LRVGLVEAAAEQELEMVFLGLVDERPVRLEGLATVGISRSAATKFSNPRSIAGSMTGHRRFRLAEFVESPPLGEIGRPAELHRGPLVFGYAMPGGSVADLS